jgi:polymerase delta-interacting protein 2
VGHFSSLQVDNYETGQLFLHKMFGYRGVILFPWTAHVFEKKDNEIPATNTSDSEEIDSTIQDRSSAKKLTYYQVLIDARDIAHIKAQPESVTFLTGSQANRTLYSITGLDYVSQYDIVPYRSSERHPIVHELFDKFLVWQSDPDSDSPKFVGGESLRAWQESNHQFSLELSDVSIRTTQNVRVTVIPFYVGLKDDQKKKLYWWRYSVRIENLTPKTSVTIRERHWRIFSQAGTFETVRGKGVIGQEPSLDQDHPVFQYSSHVNLQSPSGHMWGTFKLEKDDGTLFEVKIPSFYLECKDEDK